MVYATKSDPHSHLERLGYGIYEALPIQLGNGSQPHTIARVISREQQVLQRICPKMKKVSSSYSATTS